MLPEIASVDVLHLIHGERKLVHDGSVSYCVTLWFSSLIMEGAERVNSVRLYVCASQLMIWVEVNFLRLSVSPTLI